MCVCVCVCACECVLVSVSYEGCLSVLVCVCVHLLCSEQFTIDMLETSQHDSAGLSVCVCL